MIRMNRVFPALCLALPLWAQPPGLRHEKGETAYLKHVNISKPETNSYMTAAVMVTTMETDSGPRRMFEVWINEGSLTYPYRTLWANIHALAPMDALKLTGKTALVEFDFAGKPGVEVTAFEYDVTGYVAEIPYQPGHLRFKLVENGIEKFHNSGSGVGHWQNLRIRWSGQFENSSASVTEGVIFGTAVPPNDNASMGTSHSTYLERTRIPGPVRTGPGAPPAEAE